MPDDVKKRLDDVSRELPGFCKCKLVEEGNRHITLKFLGEVDEGEAGDVIKALGGVGGKGGAGVKPFDCSVKGVGVFPNEKFVRVVWAGVDEKKGQGGMAGLYKAVDAALAGFGFKDDNRFHAHATLARVRFVDDKRALAEFLKRHADEEFGEFKVKGFELMQSRLGRGGPEYSVVKEFSL